MKELIDKFMTLSGLKESGVSLHDFLPHWRAGEGKSTDTFSHSFTTRGVKAVLEEVHANMASLGFIYFPLRANRLYLREDHGRGVQFISVNESTAVNGRVHVRATGDAHALKPIIEDLKAQYVETGIEVRSVIELDGRGTGYDSRYMFREEERLGKKEFYPWLKSSLDKYAADFYASSQNILLLIGPPGTGKSTLLRSLILADPKRIPYIVSNDLLTESSAFVPWVQRRGSRATIVIEDADRLVTPREQGNSIMSGILNAGDGIISSSRKIIISTNLTSLKNVDQALIRDGRCFDIMQFSYLTPTEANRARVAAGLKRKRFGPEVTSLSLASALHYKDAEHHHSRQKRSIGF